MTLTGILLKKCGLWPRRYGGRRAWQLAGTILRRPSDASWHASREASLGSRQGCGRHARFGEPCPAAPGQDEPSVDIIVHEIVGDRVFPGAIERTGAAPGFADLGVPARPKSDPVEELGHQE